MDVNTILNWFGVNLEDASTWWQVGAFLGIVILVGIINHYVYRGIDSRISSATQLFRRLSYNAAQRLFAPLLALILLSIVKALLAAFALSHELIKIAISLAIALAVIRVVVYILRKSFPVTPLLKTWESIFVVIVWVTFALHHIGVLPAFFESLDKVAINIGQTRISFLMAAKAIASISIFLLLALWVSSIIERQLRKSKQIANYLQIGISKTIRVILLIIALLVSLDVIGFDLTALTVLGGALGVGIGFGLQRIASNFISGFILLFDRSIRPNDVITIGTSFGWVKELRARYVVIQDRDGVETLIPNENLVTSQVINWSYTDSNVRVKLPVQISYNNNPREAMALMIEAANSHDRVLKEPPAVARLLDFGEHGIDLELRLWINDPQNGVNNVRSDVNLEIWDRFEANNIQIPYPQRDVHLYEHNQKEE